MKTIKENENRFLENISTFIQDACGCDHGSCNITWNEPLFELEAFKKDAIGVFIRRFAEFIMRIEEEYDVKFGNEDNIRDLFETPKTLYTNLQKRQVNISNF